MTNQNKFKKMAAEIGQLSGRSRVTAWDDAQEWKERAEELVSDVFSENPKVRDGMLDRIRGCFCAQPCYAIPGGPSSPPLPDTELQRIFDCDIVNAQDAMNDCRSELEKFLGKYR